jgi:hypothetical protein
MDQFYQKIFKKAESYRREGKDGTVIDSTEFTRQKDGLIECITEITNECEKSFLNTQRANRNYEEYSFACALTQYITKYSIIKKNENDLEKNVINSYLEHGNNFLKQAKDSKLNDGNLIENTEQYDNIDSMREYCFVFCLASIDVYAPTASIETIINKAVIFDALKDGESLKQACADINNYYEISPTNSPDLLWECGTLNYKICEYKKAISYFYLYIKEYAKINNITTSEQDTKGDILDACYRIAYCYEFTDDISVGLYLFAKIFFLNDKSAFTKFSICELKEIKKWLPTSDTITEEINKINSIVKLCRVPPEKENKNNTELIHGVSHLINELVIFYPKVQSAPKSLLSHKPKYLLRIANRLMYAAACRKSIFFTCLGTNHSENNEFDDAKRIFKFILDQNIFDEKKEVHLRMEVEFYLAHAYLFSDNHTQAEKSLDKFSKYCDLLNDKEGLAHLAIYKVYLLLNRANDHFSINTFELKSALSQLDRNKPSYYTTKKIQEEWERLRKFLIAFIALREMFERNTSKTNILDVTVKRFLQCANDEYLLKKLKCREYRKGDYEFFRIDNGKCSDDIIYYIGDRSNLTECQYIEMLDSGGRTCQLGEPNKTNDNTPPIVVLSTSDKDKIQWAVNALRGRDVCYYLTSDVANENYNSINGITKGIVTIDGTDLKKLINYAYLQLVYTAITRSLFEPRAFLGLAPTKITQLYKFNVRKTKGLHDSPNTTHIYPLNEVHERFIAISSEQKKCYSEKQKKNDQTKIFEALVKVMRENSEALKYNIGAVYIPQKPNNNWYYTLKEQLLVSGFPDVYMEDKITDDNDLHLEFCNKELSKIPYQTEKDDLRMFLNKRLKRRNTLELHNCAWMAKTNCAHKVFQPIVHHKEDKVHKFVVKLLKTITLFDTNEKIINSILAVKLSNNTFFIVLFSEQINEEVLTSTSKRIVGTFFNATHKDETPIQIHSENNPDSFDKKNDSNKLSNELRNEIKALCQSLRATVDVHLNKWISHRDSLTDKKTQSYLKAKQAVNSLSSLHTKIDDLQSKWINNPPVVSKHKDELKNYLNADTEYIDIETSLSKYIYRRR